MSSSEPTIVTLTAQIGAWIVTLTAQIGAWAPGEASRGDSAPHRAPWDVAGEPISLFVVYAESTRSIGGMIAVEDHDGCRAPILSAAHR